MATVVAVLDTMWGDSAGRAPRWFSINPRNASGRRLYALTHGHSLIVTNACRELVTSASRHGKPDPAWLAENLRALAPRANVVLLCGKVAQATYAACGLHLLTHVVRMPHPAARTWTREALALTAEKIAATLAMPVSR